MKFLIIEDEAEVSELFSLWLEEDDHTISTCRDGHEGEKAIRESVKSGNPFDTIVTDLNMPNRNGHHLVQMVRSLERGKKLIPIVVVSGFIDNAHKANLLKFNEVYIINKPLTKDAFMELINKINK